MTTIKRLLISAVMAGLGTIVYVLWQQSHKPFPMVTPHLKNKIFNVLPGWENADLRPSLLAFRNSCALFLKLNPEKSVGSQHISLKAKDWQPACRAAMTMNTHLEEKIKEFFQTWFKPTLVTGTKSAKGLFTGYYAPSVKGSRQHSARYAIPIYDAESKGKVLAWVATQKDSDTLRIEGSAVIVMDNGDNVPVEYVKGGRSGLYFRETADHEFHGAQDVTLTPGYSMAIDRSWIPLGTPLWLNTAVQQNFAQRAQLFQRLMIAQDVGSAIRGAVRGDLYWGEGKKATAIGSNVRNTGQYWLLLPKKTHA
jgi:membrane-bound lytic murein transglycosylase A